MRTGAGTSGAGVRRAVVRAAVGAAVLAALPAVLGCSGAAPPPVLLGADVSFTDDVEAAAAVFRDAQGEADPITILSRQGVRAFRLRVWHDAPDGRDGTEATVALARRIRAADGVLLLDFHYSDTWADPGQQRIPRAWRGLPFPELVRAVRTYTRDVVGALAAAGATPDLVQIGNEITNGLLGEPASGPRFAELLNAGAEGVRDALGPGRARILIHFDRGGDAEGAVRFAREAIASGVRFDDIALSYYPWWHGTLDDLRNTLAALAERVRRPVWVVETGYPWTLDWSDSTHNLVGEVPQLHAGYPATPDGQNRFLRAVEAAVRETPNRLGRGVFLWAPEWVAAPGLGSAWENVARFDFTGRWLGDAP